MKSQHGRRCVKGEELRLQCEWANCNQIYNDLSDFYSHLYEHFNASYRLESLENKNNSLSCQWNECVFVTGCYNDLLRHLYFHGYHTKVKWWGLLCCKKDNLAECRSLQNRNIVPELPDGFRCDWADCYMLFDIPDQFYMHVYNHAAFAEEERINDSVHGFVCYWDGCKYNYPTKDSEKSKTGKFKLREHLRTHTKERSYACPWCGNLYVNKTKFTDHLHRQMCIESHCFQCTHCSRTFATERLLKDHMRHHVNYYKCPLCAMTCPNPSGLKHHMKYKHSDERPFQCRFCEYRSKTPYDLQVHMSFHQSDLSYRCHVKGCDYAVRSLQNLRIHFRSKHMVGMGKCYSCHLCTKTYGVGYQLTNHLRTAHGFQWPPGHSRFKYKECDDGFFRLQTFRFESVELTEKLMVDDQSSSTRSENPSNDHKKTTRPKKCKAKKKRLNTRANSSSVITRSASLLLQKAQSQKLNFRNTSRTRSLVKKNKKQVTSSSQPTFLSSSLLEVGSAENDTEQVSGGSSATKWSHQTRNDEAYLQAEFGGGGKHQIDAVESFSTAPSTDNASTFPTQTQVEAGDSLPRPSLRSDDSPSASNPAEKCSSPLTFTESINSAEQSRLAAIPDGSLVRDENGQYRSLVIDGEEYYLVKGSDAGKLITFSLVDAKNYDRLTSPSD